MHRFLAFLRRFLPFLTVSHAPFLICVSKFHANFLNANGFLMPKNNCRTVAVRRQPRLPTWPGWWATCQTWLRHSWAQVGAAGRLGRAGSECRWHIASQCKSNAGAFTRACVCIECSRGRVGHIRRRRRCQEFHSRPAESDGCDRVSKNEKASASISARQH